MIGVWGIHELAFKISGQLLMQKKNSQSGLNGGFHSAQSLEPLDAEHTCSDTE